MKHTKIVHLTSVHTPFDTRILYKECTSLKKMGYDVTLIAPHSTHFEKNDVHVRALPVPIDRSQRIKKTIWQVYRAALKENASLYHFHDPELIPVGILLRLHGKKIIYDVHENVPAQIMGKAYLGSPWKRGLLAAGAKMTEWVGAQIFNGIIGVIPEITERFPNRKAITLRNYPILKLIDETPPIQNTKSHRPVVVYAGGLTPIRGICESVQAMELLGDKAELWLIGKWESDRFKKQCEHEKGWKHVRYLGLMKPEEVYAHLKRADIGLVTMHPQLNYLFNLPVKSFEYMACSLPLVMSDFPYWRDIYKDCALFVDPLQPSTIANALIQLLEAPNLRKKLGSAGRSLVEDDFSWEVESQKLLLFYEKLLEETPKDSKS